jgi:hypothetical protein
MFSFCVEDKPLTRLADKRLSLLIGLHLVQACMCKVLSICLRLDIIKFYSLSTTATRSRSHTADVHETNPSHKASSNLNSRSKTGREASTTKERAAIPVAEDSGHQVDSTRSRST